LPQKERILSIALTHLVAQTNDYLHSSAISDYCPNGLQVEGRAEVSRVISGVTASQALIEAAISQRADVLLVHHGYFWKGENPCISGMRRQRLKALLAHDISLLAYHLPLDVHPEVGNNVTLGQALGISIEGELSPGNTRVVGLLGRLPEPLPAADFALRVGQVLRRTPLLVEGDRPVQRIGWCSGGGQGFIDEAIAAGVDLYLTGEASEQTFHSARENGISFIAAGHHATERLGVQALGQWMAQRFALVHQFIDCPNPF